MKTNKNRRQLQLGQRIYYTAADQSPQLSPAEL